MSAALTVATTTIPKLIDERAVATALGLSVDAVRAGRYGTGSLKHLPWHKLGTTVRYKESDVAAFVEGCRVATTKKAA